MNSVALKAALGKTKEALDTHTALLTSVQNRLPATQALLDVTSDATQPELCSFLQACIAVDEVNAAAQTRIITELTETAEFYDLQIVAMEKAEKDAAVSQAPTTD